MTDRINRSDDKAERKFHRAMRALVRVPKAEVEEQDVWQTAVLGLACVSNESRHAHVMLENAVSFVERLRLDAEVADYQIELVRVM